MAAGIAAAVLELCVVIAGGGPEAQALREWYPRLGLVLAIWLITGPLWVMLSPLKHRAAEVG